MITRRSSRKSKLDFTESTYSFIRRSGMLGQKGSVTVGISGGADSVCLFLQLNKLKERIGITLRAVTVEHGIRGDDSERDAEFSRALCESHGVECRVVHVDAPRRAEEKGISLEEAARQLRYEAFFENTDEGDCIALAHHMEDQAETVLFHMIRGSGVKGLIGMRPVTEMNGRYIIRPLLTATKEEILAELSKEGQDYCTDSTNSDTTYARNRLRSVIIPELEQINHGAVRHICESAESVGELYDRFFTEEKQVLDRAFIRGERQEDMRLRVSEIKDLDDTARRMILMEYLRQTLRSIKDVSREHLNRLSELVHDSTAFSYNLPREAVIRLEYGVLSVVYADDAAERIDGISLDGLGETGRMTVNAGRYTIDLDIMSRDGAFIPSKTYEKWLDYDKIKNGLCLRSRREGDFFTIDAAGHRKRFRDYCRNEKIPEADRDRIPLLVHDGSQIAWAIGYRISEDAKVTEQTKRILRIKASVEEDNGRQNKGYDHRGRARQENP